MKTISAHSPAYTVDGSIALQVQFEGLDGELPFGSSPHDPEWHGRDLYARALAGEFGPIAPYVAPVETPEQIATRLTAAVQHHLDVAARQRRYDNIHTACGWAGEFADAGALKTWAAACWRKSGEVEAAVASGARPVPTESELIAELPAIVRS